MTSEQRRYIVGRRSAAEARIVLPMVSVDQVIERPGGEATVIMVDGETLELIEVRYANTITEALGPAS